MSAVAPSPDPLARSRRNNELGLLILAVLAAVGAYALVGLGRDGEVPVGVGGYGLLMACGFMAAHMAVRKLAPGADPIFLPAAALLTGIGFAVIYRLNPDLAAAQTSWLLFALVLFALTLLIVRDHHQLDAYTYTIGLLGIGFLLMPLLPVIGVEVRGARLWVDLGPMRFQPAEIGKVLIVIFLASYLHARKEMLAVATRRVGPLTLPEPKHLGPLLMAWGISLILLFVQTDLGSSLLFFGLFVMMLWVATARGAYLVLGAVLFAAGSWLAYTTFAHVQARITVWLNVLDPEYIQEQGFQVAQSMFAMATGGIGGTGLGQGHPHFIPDAHTDFVFAAVGEELGLFGATAVLLLFTLLVARGFRTALQRSEADSFGQLLATGASVILALQTFVIIGGVTRLIPLTGITLPFVSYGGSSLVANFVLLALLVRVSASRGAAEGST